MSSAQGSTGPPHHLRALVIAGGDVPARAALDTAWPGWSDERDLLVAADGGARNARTLGLVPDLVVGDADSLTPGELDDLRVADIPIELSPAMKDATDLELAVDAAIERGATELVIVGAFGGRLDHALGNIALLARPSLQGRSATMLDGTTRLGYLSAAAPAAGADGVDARSPVRRDLPGRVGDLVSLLPLGGGADGVTTHGLQYPLRDEPLTLGSTRGVSNVRTAADAWVSLRGGHLYTIETTEGVSA
jgi:thiamine pyrophosphokinase